MSRAGSYIPVGAGLGATKRERDRHARRQARAQTPAERRDRARRIVRNTTVNRQGKT